MIKSEYDYNVSFMRRLRIFLYTDGVPESTDADDKFFGTDRMLNALNIDPHSKPKDLLENVTESIHVFVDTVPQFDDITMMSVTWYGKS